MYVCMHVCMWGKEGRREGRDMYCSSPFPPFLSSLSPFPFITELDLTWLSLIYTTSEKVCIGLLLCLYLCLYLCLCLCSCLCLYLCLCLGLGSCPGLHVWEQVPLQGGEDDRRGRGSERRHHLATRLVSVHLGIRVPHQPVAWGDGWISDHGILHLYHAVLSLFGPSIAGSWLSVLPWEMQAHCEHDISLLLLVPGHLDGKHEENVVHLSFLSVSVHGEACLCEHWLSYSIVGRQVNASSLIYLIDLYHDPYIIYVVYVTPLSSRSTVSRSASCFMASASSTRSPPARCAPHWASPRLATGSCTWVRRKWLMPSRSF